MNRRTFPDSEGVVKISTWLHLVFRGLDWSTSLETPISMFCALPKLTTAPKFRRAVVISSRFPCTLFVRCITLSDDYLAKFQLSLQHDDIGMVKLPVHAGVRKYPRVGAQYERMTGVKMWHGFSFVRPLLFFALSASGTGIWLRSLPARTQSRDSSPGRFRCASRFGPL